MQKYVLYLRVSSAEQGKSGLGLEAQERAIQLFLENYAENSVGRCGAFCVGSFRQGQRTSPFERCHRSCEAREGSSRRFQNG